jgi:5'-nucleotidase
MSRRIRRQRLSVFAASAAGALVLGALVAAPQAQAAEVTHSIAQVQGTGAATPLAINTVVTVEGIITGDHRTGGFRGLYVQTPGPDLTPGASDGIFVFVNTAAHAGVDTGDLVKVTGPVSELGTVTQITASAEGSIELVTDEAGTPTAVSLPATVLGSAREAFEGMLVSPSGTFRVVSSHNLQSFGELWTSAGTAMPVEAFETQAPGTTAATAITTANNNARLIVDDGYNIRVDNIDHPGDQPYFTKDVVV